MKPRKPWPHPKPSEKVTVDGMRHIQACEQCRINYADWVPMLDAAQAAEEAGQ